MKEGGGGWEVGEGGKGMKDGEWEEGRGKVDERVTVRRSGNREDEERRV